MANEAKGARGIRTMARLVDGRRARSPAGALLELSAMANEKQLLNRELDRWERRHVEIRARLAEIAEKERRLMAMATDPSAPGAVGAVAVGGAAVAAPTPPSAGRIKVQEISY